MQLKKRKRMKVLEASYRLPMPVKEAACYCKARTQYPICPSCQNCLEREYVNFCDCCGQCLDWENYDHALIRLYI